MRRQYRTEGFSDEGEQAAIDAMASELRGARVLDVGIGGGRTSRLLAPASSRYLGIDSSPQMVKLAQSRNPGLDLRIGDARHLSGLADGPWDVVVFSLNGIDAVDHDDRGRVLREFARVVPAGGTLLCSTLNLDGEAFGLTPAQTWSRATLPAGGARRARACATWPAHRACRSGTIDAGSRRP